MKYFALIVLLLTPESLWAAPNRNSLRINDNLSGSFMEKHIKKGDWEIGGSGGIGYSSFSGVTMSLDLTRLN